MDRLTKLYKSGCYGLVKVKDDEQAARAAMEGDTE